MCFIRQFLMTDMIPAIFHYKYLKQDRWRDRYVRSSWLFEIWSQELFFQNKYLKIFLKVAI